VEALGEALKKAGFPAEGEKLIQAALQGKGLDNRESLVSAIFGSVALTGLEERLKGMAEPTPQELQAILAEMEKIPRQLRAPLKALAKKLPHLPGGAPRKFKTEAEEKEACALVGTYMGQGYGLPEALTKVAKLKHVSLRTMQRTWQKNQQRNKPQES